MPPGYLGIFMEVVVNDNSQRESPASYKLVPTSRLLGDEGSDFRILPFLTGIEVTKEFKMATSISFSIDAPYEVGLRMLDSTLFLNQNTVYVRFGYPEGPQSQTFYGVLLKGGQALEMSAEGLTGTITASALSKTAFYTGDSRFTPVDIGGVNFGELSKEAIIAKAVKEMGGYEADFSEVDFAPSGPSADGPGRYSEGAVEEARKIQDGQTMHIDKIKDICESNGWSYVIDYDDVLGVPLVKFFQASTVSKKSPRWEFIMRGRFDPENGQIPMISFTPSVGAAWYSVMPLGGEAAAQRVKSGNVNAEGEAVVNMAQPEESEVEGGDDSDQGGSQIPEDVLAKIRPDGPQTAIIDSAVNLASELNSQMLMSDPEVSEGERDSFLRNVQDDARKNNQSWEAAVVIPGTPEIEPGDNLKITGVGTFDRVYTVRSVTHNLAVGSYETTVNCWCGEPGDKPNVNLRAVEVEGA